MSTNQIHDRFKDAPWFKQKDIIVGGVGGIGSWLTLLLSRMPNKLYLFDHDVVEPHNIGGQLYGTPHVGKNKTDAMRETANVFSDITTIYGMGTYMEDSMADNIMFSAFDNMLARRFMFNNWLTHQMNKSKEHRNNNPEEVNIFIDGRMSAETGYIYFIKTLKEAKRYQEELFTDEEVPNDTCSFRATSHCGAMIASWMVSGYTNQVVNKTFNSLEREVPYKLEFELPTMNVEITL